MHVKVFDAELPDFRRAEAVAIRDEKEGPVALRINDTEKVPHFSLGEKLDRGRTPRPAGCGV
jgi:hypothetical protein